jgi:hypothetical protein
MEPAITGHEAVDHKELLVHTWRVARLTRFGRRGDFAGAPYAGLVLVGRVLVLVGDQAAVAEGRGAGDDHGQRQRLAGQVPGPGPGVLAEQEHPEQAGRERVEDGESGLRRGQRAGRQRVRGQQHGHRPGGYEHVRRPIGEDGTEAAAEVRAELLDDRGHEPP